MHRGGVELTSNILRPYYSTLKSAAVTLFNDNTCLSSTYMHACTIWGGNNTHYSRDDRTLRYGIRFSESEKVEISIRCDSFRKGEDNLWNICDLEPSHMSRSACNRCRYTIIPYCTILFTFCSRELQSLYFTPEFCKITLVSVERLDTRISYIKLIRTIFAYDRTSCYITLELYYTFGS
jgi:hypothetical protein